MSVKEKKQFNRIDDAKSKNPIRRAREKAKAILTAEQIKSSYIKTSDPRFNHYWHQLKEDAVMSRTQHWLALHFIQTLGMKSEDFLYDTPTQESIIKDLNLELA